MGLVVGQLGREEVVVELEKNSHSGQCGLICRVGIDVVVLRLGFAGGVASVNAKKCPRFGQLGRNGVVLLHWVLLLGFAGRVVGVNAK
eukprot:9262055-Pyramimonas_sp.AAC.1